MRFYASVWMTSAMAERALSSERVVVAFSLTTEGQARAARRVEAPSHLTPTSGCSRPSASLSTRISSLAAVDQ